MNETKQTTFTILLKMLPIPKGSTFSKWCETWLKEIKDDIYSIIEDDPNAVKLRNERFGAYLPTISTLVTIYRFKAREEREAFYREHPKPPSGIKEWEERRDAVTSQWRYMTDFLTALREDLQRRISVSQTTLSVYKEELKSHLD